MPYNSWNTYFQIQNDGHLNIYILQILKYVQ